MRPIARCSRNQCTLAAGGFKLWECAVDLAQYLCKEYSLDKLVTSKTDPNFELVGKRVLELGCGQGLPGIVPLLAGAEVHFQARYLTRVHTLLQPDRISS